MLEECAICHQLSTPWKKINGHICQSCSYPDRWISIKDQLPENGSKILITDGKDVGIATYSFSSTGYSFYVTPFYMGEEKIKFSGVNLTHWASILDLPSSEITK